MKLIFVYNAEAGLAAGIMDSVHKLVSPQTYECDLCAITHGVLRMDPRWKRWMQALPHEIVVHHRPDFRAVYPALDVALPCVLQERDGQMQSLVSAAELAELKSADALIAVIERKLNGA